MIGISTLNCDRFFPSPKGDFLKESFPMIVLMYFRAWLQSWICMRLKCKNTNTRSNDFPGSYKISRRNISRRRSENSKSGEHLFAIIRCLWCRLPTLLYQVWEILRSFRFFVFKGRIKFLYRGVISDPIKANFICTLL